MCQEQWCWLQKKLLGRASIQGRKTGCGASEEHAGRALKLCQLDQGAVVPHGEKATASLSPAPTTTDRAVQRELQWNPATTQVSAASCAPLSGQSQMAAVSTAVGGEPRRCRRRFLQPKEELSSTEEEKQGDGAERSKDAPPFSAGCLRHMKVVPLSARNLILLT